MELYQILGNKELPDNRTRGISSYFFFDYSASWDVRGAEDSRSIARRHRSIDAIATEWHQDSICGDPAGALILWANSYPTELLLPDGSIVSGKPNDIVLIDNIRVKHRMPLSYVHDVMAGVDKSRTFARALRRDEPDFVTINRWKYELSKGMVECLDGR